MVSHYFFGLVMCDKAKMASNNVSMRKTERGINRGRYPIRYSPKLDEKKNNWLKRQWVVVANDSGSSHGKKRVKKRSKRSLGKCFCEAKVRYDEEAFGERGRCPGTAVP